MDNRLEGEMLDVLDFLEQLGTDARFRHASPDHLKLALSGMPIEQPVREAVLAADVARVRALAGKAAIFSILMPGREDDEEEREDEEDEDVPPEEHIRSFSPPAAAL